MQILAFVYGELHYGLCVSIPPCTTAILTPLPSPSPFRSSSCKCLVYPSNFTSAYVVFSVFVGVISRATLSISSPLVLSLHFHFALCAFAFSD